MATMEGLHQGSGVLDRETLLRSAGEIEAWLGVVLKQGADRPELLRANRAALEPVEATLLEERKRFNARMPGMEDTPLFKDRWDTRSTSWFSP